MCVVALSFVSAACTIPGDADDQDKDDSPLVSEVAPREGDYGTSLTVRGERLTGATVSARAPDGEVVQIVGAKKSPSKSKGSPQPALAIEEPLTFRFPFPAEGEMTLTAAGKDVSLGAFMPKTSPGRPAPFPEGSRVHGASVLGDATVAFVETGGRAGFLVFGPGEPRFVAVEPALGTIESAAIRRDEARIDVVVRSGEDVVAVAFDGNVATATKYAPPSAGSVLGAGVDAIGIVVVVETSEGIVRMRGEAPTLTADGPAVAVPAYTSKYKARAVSADGTVVFAWSGSGGNVLDETARFSMQGLASTATAWGPGTSIGSLDDTATSLTASVEGGVVHLNYCAVDSGFFQSTETHCAATKTVDGTTKLELPSSQAAVAIEPGRIGYARCGQEGYVVIGAVGETPHEEMKALYPCHGVQPTVASVDGARLVVQRNGKLWAPRTR
jgi:hypothetical protein